LAEFATFIQISEMLMVALIMLHATGTLQLPGEYYFVSHQYICFSSIVLGELLCILTILQILSGHRHNG